MTSFATLQKLSLVSNSTHLSSDKSVVGTKICFLGCFDEKTDNSKFSFYLCFFELIDCLDFSDLLLLL